MSKGTVGGAITAVVGLLILVVGCILIPVFDDLVEDTVVESVRYEEGTDGFDNFVESDSPTYMQLWVFNLTNYEDVMLDVNYSKPHVQQMGPYTYLVKKTKENLTFLEDGTIIRYLSKNIYFFEPDMSTGDENDTFINVNFPVLTIAEVIDDDVFRREIVRVAINNQFIGTQDRIFEPRTVSEFFWGYVDELSSNLGLDDTYGIFYGSNNSVTGSFEVFSGTGNVDDVNEIYKWNDNETLPYWTTDLTNMINGTDGTQYKPFLKRDDIVYTFSTDVCRSFKTRYEEDVDIKDIPAFRMVLDEDNFLRSNPDNIGYCIPSGEEDDCLPSAFLNLQSCIEGNPPFISSNPHWYLAPDEVVDRIEGLFPNRAEHYTAIDVEPTTGLTINGNKRLQLNARIKPWRAFPDSEAQIFQDGLNYSGVLFPIFWLNETSTIKDDSAADFRSEILEPIDLLEIIQYVVIGVGAFVLLTGLIVVAIFACKSSGSKYV